MSPKVILRGEIKKLLKEVSEEKFGSQGIKAAGLLRSSPMWPAFGTVFLFLSRNTEIDTQPLLELALKEGRKVFAPRIEAEKIVFYPLLSPDGPWRKGPLGIREPGDFLRESGESGPATAEHFPALILTPGLAFDREGNRLGRGKGYYDRFFAELDEGGREYTALGFCMDFQVVDRVPVEERDKKMSGLLTGTELISIAGGKKADAG